MKQSRLKKFFIGSLLVIALLIGTAAMAATIGTIDPAGAGKYKAAFLDTSVVSDPAINFGKFTTQSQYNIKVSDTELRGYAWGSSVGYIVMNCADTTSGCSSTNGNFKVANNGGLLSGYAWGENTGWINFGPFTNPGVSTVKIGSDGNFGGTSGTAGYAWSQNYGWIVFDCSNANTCVNTDWGSSVTPPTSGGGGISGGGFPPIDSTLPLAPGLPYDVPPGSTITVTASNIVCDSTAAMPHWGNGGAVITATTAASYVANSNGHCSFGSGQSYQWNGQTTETDNGVPAGTVTKQVAFGPTDQSGSTTVVIPFYSTKLQFLITEIVRPGFIPFTFTPSHQNNSNPNSAEFYCHTDGLNYDYADYVIPPAPGAHFYCVSFNVPSHTTTTPPANPTNPSSPSNPGLPGNGGITGPEQPPAGSNPGGTSPTQPPTGAGTQPIGNPTDTNEPGLFDNGITLPPSFVEAVNGIVGSIGTTISAIADSLKPLATGILTAARTDSGKTISHVTSGLGILLTIIASVGLLFLSNPISFADFLLMLLRLWNLILIFFGARKRHHPWGTVYDSVTKQPIDPAYVMLMDMEGNEVATSLTDIDGRYGFSVPPGTYKIVANKTNFEFPSKKLAGRTADELYTDLYFGETIVTKEEGEVIIKNIPMDQLNFDWNEFAKTEQKRLSYYKKSDLTLARLSSFFFWFGFTLSVISLIAEQSVYNKIVFVIYLAFFLIRQYAPQFQPKGSITDSVTDDPLPFAILRIQSLATGQEIMHKVADRLGSYYCLIPNGTYSVLIDKKNADASYTKVAVPGTVTVSEGYLKENFKV